MAPSIDELYGMLRTTVIGSFPLPHSEENMARAMDDQVEAGVDYPCYGQLLDMNMMFLEPLAEQGCGVEIRGGEAWLVGEPRPPAKPIGVELLRFALDHLSRRGARVMGVKVPVTGPMTLASAIKVSDRHRAVEYPDIVLALADVVASIARGYDEAGARIITIDEPCLPYALYSGLDRDYAIEAIERAARGISRAIPSIHCCGDVRPVVGLLMEASIPVLSFAFKASPGNLDAISRADLERHDKMLGLGCIDSNPDPQLLLEVASNRRPLTDVVEPVEEVEALIVEAGRRLGFERLLIHPDCGFGGLRQYFKDDRGQLIAREKLRVMVEAVRRVRRSLGLA